MGVGQRLFPSAVSTEDLVGHTFSTIERISMLNWNGFDPTGDNDSTDYINDAFEQALNFGVGNNRGAVVELPSGLITVTDCLHIGRGAFQYGSVGFIGQSPYSTQIVYEGPTDGRPAIMVDGQKGATIGNFLLSRSGAKGQSVGIAFGADSGSGTQCVSCLMLPISVGGFFRGAFVGNYSSTGLRDGVAASELRFIDFSATDCDVGMYLHNQNTLNIWVQINASLCNYGLYANTAQAIWVEGGAGAENAIADFYNGSGGNFGLKNYRTERCNRLLITEQGQWRLEGIEVADYKAVGHDGTAIELPHQGHIIMDEVDLGAGEIATAGGNALCRLSARLSLWGTDGSPIIDSGTLGLAGCQAVLENCILDGVDIPHMIYQGGSGTGGAAVMTERLGVRANGTLVP